MKPVVTHPAYGSCNFNHANRESKIPLTINQNYEKISDCGGIENGGEATAHVWPC
jgi:hypothetical protein